MQVDGDGPSQWKMDPVQGPPNLNGDGSLEEPNQGTALLLFSHKLDGREDGAPKVSRDDAIVSCEPLACNVVWHWANLPELDTFGSSIVGSIWS